MKIMNVALQYTVESRLVNGRNTSGNAPVVLAAEIVGKQIEYFMCKYSRHLT